MARLVGTFWHGYAKRMEHRDSRGTEVIVRTYGGRPEIRYIWEARPSGFIVTEAPDDDRFAVGIPAADVFRFDPIAARSVGQGGRIDWSKLECYTEP